MLKGLENYASKSSGRLSHISSMLIVNNIFSKESDLENGGHWLVGHLVSL
jgi:hypothetical protein